MTENPPPWCDPQGNFLLAEFKCPACGSVAVLHAHPSMLSDLGAIQQWLNENQPCQCPQKGS